jgi:hypothetical protein
MLACTVALGKSFKPNCPHASLYSTEVFMQNQDAKKEYQKPTVEPCGNWQELVAVGTLPVGD